jgi:hypothetical protein
MVTKNFRSQSDVGDMVVAFGEVRFQFQFQFQFRSDLLATLLGLDVRRRCRQARTKRP